MRYQVIGYNVHAALRTIVYRAIALLPDPQTVYPECEVCQHNTCNTFHFILPAVFPIVGLNETFENARKIVQDRMACAVGR